MGEAAGQVLSFGVGVSLSPIPIIAVVLMLATPKGRINGPAFLLGWVLGLSILGTIVLLVSSGAGASDAGQPASGTSYLKIGLGILLFGVALRQCRGRPREGSQPELPSWMKSIDSFTPIRSGGIAFVLAAINPKNLILVVGAAAAIAGTGTSSGAQAGSLAVFVLIATLGPAIPVGIYFLMRDRADALLASLKSWMTRENATIMAVICLVIGAKLIGDGISGLSA